MFDLRFLERRPLIVGLEIGTSKVCAMVGEIKELAANYREEGKRYFLQIEDCSLMTSEVRSVCEMLKKKIAAGSSLAA